MRRLFPVLLRSLAFPALAASLCFTACNRSNQSPDTLTPDAGEPDTDEPDAGEPDTDEPDVGPPGVMDDPDDDPDDVTIVVEDDDLVVDIDDLAEGEYELAIVSVDGSDVHSAITVETQPDEASADLVGVRLKLPEVNQQAELVNWNLRVRETSSATDEVLLLRSLLYALDPYEVRLEGPARVTEGKQVAYRLKAQHPVTREGLKDRDVQLTVDHADESQTLTATTDDRGVAVVHVTPEEAGSYDVSAVAKGDWVDAVVTESVEVTQTGNKVLLTTDKPLYKPGQTMHLRALALDAQGNTPSAEVEALFQVEDGKGNKIMRRELVTDEYGIAATSFKIGSIVNQGTFKITTSVGGVTTEKSVSVEQYALPKFRVSVDTDRDWYQPGDEINGVIDSRYFFGKAVQNGEVLIEAATVDVGVNVYQQVMGRTDSEGRYEFSVRTPETLVGLPLEQGLALISLRVAVTDAAGQEVTQESAVRVAQQPFSISLVPEATELVTGIENRLHLFVTDPLGAPVNMAEVTITPVGGEPIELTTGPAGHAEVAWIPGASTSTLIVDVTLDDVAVRGEEFNFDLQDGVEHVLVRTDQSVYEVGDTVSVEVLTTDDSGSIFVDWLNEGQAVDLRTLGPEDGSASFEMTLDPTLIGSNRVEAYIVQEDGNLVRAGRTVFVKNASSLSVELATDHEIYEPGQPAELTFTVTDEEGVPTAAALGVQIVDEAVFALVDAKPGLLKTYFELEDEFAEPHYQLRAPPGSLVGTLFAAPEDDEEEQAVQVKAEATLAALGDNPVMGLSEGSWAAVVSEGKNQLRGYLVAEKQRIVGLVNPRLASVGDTLIDQGCDPNNYWCDALDQRFVDLFSEELVSRLEVNDFWGNAYVIEGTSFPLLTLISSGPDELVDTADDVRIEIEVGDLDLSAAPALQAQGGADAGVAPGGGLAGGGEPQDDRDVVDFDGLEEPTAEPDSEPPSQGEDGDRPRIRQDFPETLYVNPSVITDGSGTATVNLDMADSITEWRVSTLANSAGGKLGSAVDGITVFQDFFVDVDFPATLTRGDEIEFPIAIYNYLDEAQTVSIELEAADWYTPLGDTAANVDMAAGEVRGISFPVRVEDVGRNTLTVFGLGSDKSDAVARSVLVEPDGKEQALAQSGSVEGSVNHTVTFTENAIEGSELLYLNVFPTFLSQAVEGMDSMLQTPNGCFEQTTSSAWPNVLVTEYMQETDQITPEILLRAESLMSAGYQRLLTFEHPGGGFSWFGTQDNAPFLSVTAFGLMEFSDMARVHPVDEDMLERTQNYLLSQQQADGSWEGDISEFFDFHTSGIRNTAFTLWALASSGYSGQETDLALSYIQQQLGMESADAYTLALVANAFALLDPASSTLSDTMEELLSQVKFEGEDEERAFWDSAGTQTNFYGYGNDAAVSTTALVVHAMLQIGGYGDSVTRGLEYLTAQKDTRGNFGSTQATIWTLRTLILAASKGTEAAVGTLVVELDGEEFSTLELTAETSEVMRTVDMTSLASTGEHQLTLTFAGEGRPSYSLVSSEHVPWDDAPPEGEGPLSVSIDYDRSSLSVDETVTATARVQNNTENPQNMVLVTVGLPPGFEVQSADLAPYLEEGSLSNYETTGKQLILYVSELEASAEQVFSYRLRATMPVKASDGGASVYPYYEPDQKSQAESQELEVVAAL